MGGYASFPICVAASILKIKFFIYENNLVIGKANQYLLPLANKIFVANNEIEGIPKKYNNKVIEIGNIIKRDLYSSNKNSHSSNYQKMNILVLGGAKQQKYSLKNSLIYSKLAQVEVLHLKFFSIVYPVKMIS